MPDDISTSAIGLAIGLAVSVRRSPSTSCAFASDRGRITNVSANCGRSLTVAVLSLWRCNGASVGLTASSRMSLGPARTFSSGLGSPRSLTVESVVREEVDITDALVLAVRTEDADDVVIMEGVRVDRTLESSDLPLRDRNVERQLCGFSSLVDPFDSGSMLEDDECRTIGDLSKMLRSGNAASVRLPSRLICSVCLSIAMRRSSAFSRAPGSGEASLCGSSQISTVQR